MTREYIFTFHGNTDKIGNVTKMLRENGLERKMVFIYEIRKQIL